MNEYLSICACAHTPTQASTCAHTCMPVHTHTCMNACLRPYMHYTHVHLPRDIGAARRHGNATRVYRLMPIHTDAYVHFTYRTEVVQTSLEQAKQCYPKPCKGGPGHIRSAHSRPDQTLPDFALYVLLIPDHRRRTYRQADRQTHIQTVRQTYIHTDIHTVKY